MADAGNITRLLQEADQGNADAANQLYLLVEEDLRLIARKRKRGAGNAVDASTTVLVNDAFMRLVGQDVTTWQPGDRRKFFGYISNKMHDSLIDELRKQGTKKRGADMQRQALGDVAEAGPRSLAHLDLLTDLKESLLRLQEFALEDAIVFRIRFFLDCTFEETAEIMGLSKTEAIRSYTRTQLWLKRELKEYDFDA